MDRLCVPTDLIFIAASQSQLCEKLAPFGNGSVASGFTNGERSQSFNLRNMYVNEKENFLKTF